MFLVSICRRGILGPAVELRHLRYFVAVAETENVSGAVVYGPEPLDKPADGNLLVCCSQPIGDVVIDL